MEFVWNLSEIFENNEEFYNAIQTIKKMLRDMKHYEEQELDENTCFDMLKETWNIKELANNVLIYGSFMYYKNIKSEECIELKSVAEDVHNQVKLELQFVDRKILDLGKTTMDDYVARNHDLEIYRFFLDNLFRLEEHVQDNEISTEVKNNCDLINAQLNRYNQLLHDMEYGEILIDGKLVSITSSNYIKYLTS